jgi:hypothetical protein
VRQRVAWHFGIAGPGFDPPQVKHDVDDGLFDRQAGRRRPQDGRKVRREDRLWRLRPIDSRLSGYERLDEQRQR